MRNQNPFVLHNNEPTRVYGGGDNDYQSEVYSPDVSRAAVSRDAEAEEKKELQN